MIWRIFLHIRMRWHEVRARAAAQRALAEIDRVARHTDAASALSGRLEISDADA